MASLELSLGDRCARHLVEVLEAVEAGETPGAIHQRPDVATPLLALIEALEVGALEGEVGRGRFLDPDLEVLALAGELLADPRQVLLEVGMGGDGHAPNASDVNSVTYGRDNF